MLEYNPVRLYVYATGTVQTGGLLLATRAQGAHRGVAAVCFVGVLQLEMKFRQFHIPETNFGRSRWLRGLRRGSAAARLLGMRVRIPSGAWISVFLSAVCVCGQVEVSAMG